MSNSFGRIFRFTSFGESHGPALGVVIDGCPSGLKLDMEFIQSESDRRRPGQNALTTQRKEEDKFELLSGTVGGITTGAPLAFIVRNFDQRPGDYKEMEQVFRPSHADYTYFMKYGLRDARGGGRSSARETLARVIAGAVAKQLLVSDGIQIQAWVEAIGNVRMLQKPSAFSYTSEAAKLVNCPDAETASRMVAAIETARDAGDSLGGIIACSASGVPAGLGAPIYDKLEARLASAMLSINATKGFEVGSGFAGAAHTGSENNDAFYMEGDHAKTRTNHSGGIQGGISNGEEIFFRVAFKPTSTIAREQETVTASGDTTTLAAKGRHDPCVVPRATVIVEAMAAVVIADFMLLRRGDKMNF